MASLAAPRLNMNVSQSDRALLDYRCLPGTDTGVAVLGNLLVGLLAGTGSGLLDLLGNVVGTLLDGIHYDGLVGVLRFCLF